MLSHVWLFVILCDPMAGNCQTPLSMEFSRQEYWSRQLFPPPRDLLDPRIKPKSPVFQADSSLSEPAGKPNIMVLWYLIETATQFYLSGSFGHGILQARIQDWVAISFSGGYSGPRDQIRVSCIAGRFFTNWAMREALNFTITAVIHKNLQCFRKSGINIR